MSTPSEIQLFRSALAVQSRVVAALVLREMRVRYGRSKLGYFWAIAEPVGYVLALSAVFTFAGMSAPFGPSMALFFVLGVIPFRLFMTLGNQLAAAFTSNEALLTYPIVKEIDTVIARFLLEVLTSIGVLIIVLSALTIALDLPPPASLPQMALGMSLLAAYGLGVGLFNAVLARYVGSWPKVFQILTAPMLFISAVFYSLASLPTQARELLVWNPIIHGVEQVRYGYYSNYRAPGLAIDYLFWLAILAILLGLVMERALRVNR